jgi:hypothetical protein
MIRTERETHRKLVTTPRDRSGNHAEEAMAARSSAPRAKPAISTALMPREPTLRDGQQSGVRSRLSIFSKIEI